MNAGNAHTYSDIHRTSEQDFERVWSNIDQAVKQRLLCSNIHTAIGIQSLILPENLETLDELANRASSSGADYLVLKPYVHNVYMNQPGYSNIDYTRKEYHETLLKLQSKWDNADFKVIARANSLEKLSSDVERYKTCWSTPALWFYVSGDGSVYSCGAHVGNENFYLGNVKTEDIDQIWRSENRCNCLNYVQDELNLESCRRTCRMDEVNKYLDTIMNNKVDHVNFI